MNTRFDKEKKLHGVTVGGLLKAIFYMKALNWLHSEGATFVHVALGAYTSIHKHYPG